jgi:hypothetical protein
VCDALFTFVETEELIQKRYSLAVAWGNELVIIDVREGEILMHEEPEAGSKKAHKARISALDWFISTVGPGALESIFLWP